MSSATVTGGAEKASAILSWLNGPESLALIAVVRGQNPAAADRTPVTLGCSAEVNWANGKFSIAVVPATGTVNAIAVTFGLGIPSSACIGVVVGPGPILVPVPASGGKLVLTPDLTPAVKVQFGTALDPGNRSFSDVSQVATVPCTDAAAAIAVGIDNVITLL